MGTELQLEDVRLEIRKMITPVTNDLDKLSSTVERIGAVTTQLQNPQNYAEVVNLLNNSHPEWSTAAYTALGVTFNAAGDTNLECYNFYRDAQSQTNLVAAAATALKAAKTTEPADHTLWAANEGTNADIPRWNKAESYIEAGGLTQRWDLFIPLPNDLVFPGQTFLFQFEAKLRNAAVAKPLDLQVYSGFWDNTAGQRKFIEGGNFTITGEIVGTPGATTVEYQILAFTDSGEQALSNVLTFTTAPAVFSNLNYPRISFAGVPGFIRFEIYRKIGSTYVLQYIVGNTIESSYSDIGNPPAGGTVSGWPTVTTTVPRAYAVSTNFVPGAGTFLRNELRIFVPTTYNRSLTASGQQFLRFGFTGTAAEARQFLMRKFALSMGSGTWARSSADLTTGVHSSPTTGSTGSDAGNGPGTDPPPGPGGGGYCVLHNTPIEVLDAAGKRSQRALKELIENTWCWIGGPVCSKVKNLHLTTVSRIFRVTGANGKTLGCGPGHRLITDRKDLMGTSVEQLQRRLELGMRVAVLGEVKTGVIGEIEIVDIQEELGEFLIGYPELTGNRLYITNGFLSHNLKLPYEEV